MGALINTLDNIGILTNLEVLNLYENNLSTIDVSKNVNLTVLVLDRNKLSSLDVSKNVNLTSVRLNLNMFTHVTDNLLLPDSVTSINLGNNPIVNFNPTVALPSVLEYLTLWRTDIVIFNPTIPLPNSLQYLRLGSQMTNAGYTASEPWANAMSTIPSRGTIWFTENIDSIEGTNLQTILESKGWGAHQG